MSRLWLVTSNDRKLLPCVLAGSDLGSTALSAQNPGVLGAGIFTAGSEVLSLKRPVDAGLSLDAVVGENIRSTRILACIDERAGAGFRSEDVQPFRHKGWVFAVCGDDPPEVERDEYEDAFVKRNLRGRSPQEALFNLLCSRVYRHAAQTQRPPAPQALADIVQGVVARIDPERFKSWTISLTCESIGVVVTRGRPVYWRTVERVRRCARCSDDAISLSRDANFDGHQHLRATVVVDGVEVTGQGWKRLADGEALVVEADPPARVL